AIHVVVSSMAGFALAKFKFPFSKVLFEIVVVALLFTGDVIGVMRYLILAKIGMIDTVWSLLLPSIAAPLGLFLMTQFMKSIHNAMIEAAQIDGASTFYMLWHIIMPNSKPAWMTLIIFCFQSVWNMTGTNYVYSEQLKLLPTVFSQIASSGIARVGVGAASAVLMMALPMITFLFAQSQIMQTMSHSGIRE
ncbi:MAG: carbohydrate ABC transporter permease, partial [Candidatus Delongbacteria bacterium]